MTFYRKRPVVIKAIQYIGDDTENLIKISEFINEPLRVDYGFNPPVIKIDTLEGTMIAIPGDYIIKGIAGEFYPCKKEIFEKTYDKIK